MLPLHFSTAIFLACAALGHGWLVTSGVVSAHSVTVVTAEEFTANRDSGSAGEILDYSGMTAVQSPYTPIEASLPPVDSEIRRAALDGIFGTDDRRQISSTTAQPWSMVVQLIATWKSGDSSTCSGFMIGARTVGTAGHCVYSVADGGWPTRVLAIPLLVPVSGF